MRTLDLTQGDAGWHAHRAMARNASEASVMMGSSKNATRSDLVRLKATGSEREYSRWVEEVLFPRGHEVEPALRAIAEGMIDQELYPIVAVSDDGYLSASFDGVTMDETVFCECKQANAAKMEAIRRHEIPAEDRWQVVQQFAVNDRAETCIYACGDGTDEGTETMVIDRAEVEADIATLRAAWAQLDEDVRNYQPEPVKVEVAAAPIEGFGALALRVEGRVLASNLDAFRAGAEAFIARLPKPAELQTDQDFADADAAVKACAEAESRIKAAKDAALAQMADVEAVMRAADTIAETIRAARLALDKAVKAEKENRRAELIRGGAEAVRAHYAAINATMAEFRMDAPCSITSDIGAAIKGLKSLDSIRDKIATAVAHAKIAASQEADRRRLCIAVINQHAEHRALIPDAAALVASKSPEDLRNLITARVAEHEAKVRKQAEEAAEKERDRIRREEEARANSAAAESLARAQKTVRDLAQDTDTPPPELVRPALAPAAAGPPPEASPVAADRPGARIKLGQINEAISPLRIDAAGLAALGFQPVATDGAAKLYGVPVARIVSALISHLQSVAANHGNRRAA